jgi:outer membrane lipoprotein-sorting protein
MRTIIIALISVFACTSMAAPAPKEIEDLLGKMRKAYSSITTADMEVRVKRFTPSGQQSGRFSVKFESPNMLRYVGDVGKLHVEKYSNGKVVVLIQNATRTSDKMVNVGTLSANLPGNLEWLCLFDWKRQLSTTPPKGQTSGGNTMAFSTFKLIPSEAWNNKKWIVLEETAKQLDSKVRYFVDPKTFFMWKVDVFSVANKQQVLQTQVTKLNQGVKFDSKIFEAPAERRA